MNPWLLACLMLAGLAVVFALAYAISWQLDNYSGVDVVWSYAFGAVALGAAIFSTGWLPRRIAIAVIVTIWSLRLGTHLLRRIAAHHPEEDGRYRRMRENWGNIFLVKMFGFFQLQAASVLLLGWPFLLVAQNGFPGFQWVEIAGAGLWLVALTGESVADAQLAAFKRDPAHRRKVCDRGLWRFSRHPNYFFEWLIWVAYFVFALGTAQGWLAALSPLGMLLLLRYVTGVPPAEEQSLRSRGAAYRDYQRRTSAFFPWLPRQPSGPDPAPP